MAPQAGDTAAGILKTHLKLWVSGYDVTCK